MTTACCSCCRSNSLVTNASSVQQFVFCKIKSNCRRTGWLSASYTSSSASVDGPWGPLDVVIQYLVVEQGQCTSSTSISPVDTGMVGQNGNSPGRSSLAHRESSSNCNFCLHRGQTLHPYGSRLCMPTKSVSLPTSYYVGYFKVTFTVHTVQIFCLRKAVQSNSGAFAVLRRQGFSRAKRVRSRAANDELRGVHFLDARNSSYE